MTPLIRMMKLLAMAPTRSRIGPLDESTVKFRVWPNDLDVNVHMNNGRYLTLMDLGRFDLIARNGLLRVVARNRLMPLVGSAMMRYFKPIGPFSVYDLRSRILAWDEKWFYVEHRFDQRGTLMALGVIKGLFRGREGNLPPARMLELGGLTVASPPLPDWVHSWGGADRSWAEASLGSIQKS